MPGSIRGARSMGRAGSRSTWRAAASKVQVPISTATARTGRRLMAVLAGFRANGVREDYPARSWRAKGKTWFLFMPRLIRGHRRFRRLHLADGEQSPRAEINHAVLGPAHARSRRPHVWYERGAGRLAR